MDANNTNPMLNENIDDETVDNNENVNTENNTEEKAEVKGGLFKKLITKTTAGMSVLFGFFKKIFTGNKDAEVKVDGEEAAEKSAGFFKKIGGKIKNFFTTKVDFTQGEDAIRSAGLSAQVAYRCARFVKKIFKNANRKINESKLAAVFHVITKIIAVAVTAVFAAAVIYYFIQLLPTIFAALAKCIAICCIVEVVFLFLGATTQCYVPAD